MGQRGGEGGEALAEEVLRLIERPNDFAYIYEDDMSIEEKISAIATKIYRADRVIYTPAAKKQLATIKGTRS